MTSSATPIVDGRGHTIWHILSSKSYHLDYYQRSYVWEKNEVTKLVDDLSSKFLEVWSPVDNPQDVRGYDPYFLGPFITYHKSDKLFLADGQQRFVTLLLLLIHLRRLLLQQDLDAVASNVSPLISSFQFGVSAFSIAEEAYRPCFDALLNDRPFDPEDDPVTTRIFAAFQEIENHLQSPIRDDALTYFVDWLLHRVSLVEIGAQTEKRAWEVFQSMNDRGLKLRPLDHLKGYLLSDAIGDRRPAEEAWMRMTAALDRKTKSATSDFVQSALRARFAQDKDLDPKSQSVGPDLTKATHEWVRAREKLIWPDYQRGNRAELVVDLLAPLADSYRHMLQRAIKCTEGYEALFFNEYNGISQQFDLTLASLRPTDSTAVKNLKIKAVANFVDGYVVSGAVNNRGYSQQEVDAAVRRLLPDVRATNSIHDLRLVLADHVRDELTFEGVDTLRLKDSNKTFIRYLLARITAWLNAGADKGDQSAHYLSRNNAGAATHHIEHLLPDVEGPHTVHFQDAKDYTHWRNRVGALLLLSGSENSGINATPLSMKIKPYAGQNLLAASLGPDVHDTKVRGYSRFRSFTKKQGLRGLFTIYQSDAHLKELIDSRSVLYRAICERIWNLETLGLTTGTSQQGGRSGQSVGRRSRISYGVDMENLLTSGALVAGATLVGHHLGQTYRATILPDHRIKTASGGAFDSPSKAAMDALNRESWNGWKFWRVESTGETLDIVRMRYLGKMS